MSNKNIKNIVGTASAVLGGVVLMTKLGIDELQHRNMKAKTDPSNVYSSVRILPDLVSFSGYCRIHRVNGNIVFPVPRKDSKQENKEEPLETPKSNDENQNDVEEENDNTDIEMSDYQKKKDKDEKNKDVEIKWLNESAENDKNDNKESQSWLSSMGKRMSKSLNKLQTMYESQTTNFQSSFPRILKDSAIHCTELEKYIMENDRFLDLFEPIDLSSKCESDELPLNEKWEFCVVKIHHETLYIRYANKWITMPLNKINISPLNLNNFDDSMSFIVDYQKYFVISEPMGFVLLCQHFDDAFNGDNESESLNSLNVSSIDIPSDYSNCPLPFCQKYLIGHHNATYVSLRKEYVLKNIVRNVSKKMNDDGYENHSCYNHAIQFRKCIDHILSQMINDKAENNDNDHDNDKMSYLNLLKNNEYGLNEQDLSEIDWNLTSEAAYLSNYVYDIHVPQRINSDSMKRRDSWTSFKSYIPYASASNSNLLKPQNNDDNGTEEKDENLRFCGPPNMDFESDPLWRKHSNTHYHNLSKMGFELLDYAVTMNGQSVQWMICRSYLHSNTLYLTFKGTSNPLDAMVNIGMHPLELPYFECSVFSGMYAALQQSLAYICKKLKIYSSDEYFQQNPCPPSMNNNDDEDDENEGNVTKIHRLIINGHSLGGGYAQLCLAHLLSSDEFFGYFKDIKCITFGSPLVFCKDVKKSFFYQKLNKMCFHFVYQFDLVPRLQNGYCKAYRNKLLQGLLMSQLPVSNIGIVFDINQRLNYVLGKLQQHQWLLDRYCSVGRYVVLFEKDEPRPIDKSKKCFTKSARSLHLCLDANTVLTMTSMVPENELVYASEVLKDHKMLNYMKTCMFQMRV